MSARFFFRVSVLCALAAGACSKKESSDGDSGRAAGAGRGAGGTAATGGAGGKGAASGSGGTGAGPAITTAPPAWAPPADCGGIGELCPNLAGCGERSACQLEGNVCIPKWTGTMLPSRTAETPYCAAYTCMTFEEASCFCTGPAGKDSPACSSPSALAGLCAPPGGSCASRACCDGASCVDNGSHVFSCQQTCAAGSECSTGCCTDLYDTGVSICAKADACTTPCKRHGEKCNPGSSTTPNDCCRGSCLQSDVPEWDGCRPDCTTNADCADTGCCVPFTDSTRGFCADARFCSCGEVGARCSGAEPSCCDGTRCVAFSDEAEFGCHEVCAGDADCPGAKCLALSDGSASVCHTETGGGTGGAGGMGGIGGTGGTTGGMGGTAGSGGGTCAALGKDCGGTIPGCCSGMACASLNEGEPFVCYVACSGDGDCPSGACLMFEDGSGGVCYPDCADDDCDCNPGGPTCPGCVPADSTCGIGYAECCTGSLCITDGPAATGICGKPCTGPSDCASNCCSTSIGNCAPASVCGL